MNNVNSVYRAIEGGVHATHTALVVMLFPLFTAFTLFTRSTNQASFDRPTRLRRHHHVVGGRYLARACRAQFRLFGRVRRYAGLYQSRAPGAAWADVGRAGATLAGPGG